MESQPWKPHPLRLQPSGRWASKAHFGSADCTSQVYNHGNVGGAPPKRLDLVLTSRFQKFGENPPLFHSPADAQTGKLGVFPLGS